MQCQAWSPKREPGSPLDPRSTDCRHMPSCILPYPFAVSKHRLPLVARSSTNIIDQRAKRAYLSINPSIDQFPRAIPLLQSNSQLSTDRNTCNALNLKAQPFPFANQANRTAPPNTSSTHRPARKPYRQPNRTVPHSRHVKPEAPFSHLSSLFDHHHLQAHGISLNQPIALESPQTISESSPLCAQHPQIPPVFPTSNRHQHNIAPYSASQPPLQAYPQVAFPCLSPYSGNSPFLLDHAASTSVACMVSNTPVPDRKGCPTAHRR